MRFLFTNPSPMIVYGLAPALVELGQEIKVVDIQSEYQVNHDFLPELVLEYRPDFVFTAGGWGTTYDILFPALINLKVPHIFWAFDDPPLFYSLSMDYARVSKYVLTTAEECIPLYRKHGIEAHLMMFACLPSFHHPVAPREDMQYDLIFIGNNYSGFPGRLQGVDIILRPLIDRGYNLKIYGNDWWLDRNRPFSVDPAIYGGYLGYEEMRAAYSSAKIVLGVHSVTTSQTMMSMRTFEALGCGAFFLTQWTQAVESGFKNHEHLVWSKSPEETIELVGYYLAHPEERRRIGEQGQAEVYARHSYLDRAQDILNMINNIPANTPDEILPPRRRTRVSHPRTIRFHVP